MKTKFSKDMTRKLNIIEALHSSQKPSLKHIATVTDMPRATVQRQVFDLRNSFLMDIRYVRAKGSNWKSGHYEIFNWGLFNKDSVLSQFQ